MGNGQVKVLLINVQHVVIVNPKAQKSMLKDIGTTARIAGQKCEVKIMNKYGGISDIHCDKRIYNLWYQMLRRCYDTEQHKRSRGSSYSEEGEQE